jgi:hypothetical protein
LLASYFYQDTETGDNSNLNNYAYANAPNLRQFFHDRKTEAGYVHRFGPQAIFMSYFTYGSLDWHTMNNITTPDVFNVFGIPVDMYEYVQRRQDQEYYNAQVQQQLILGNHTFIGGFDYFSGKYKDRLYDLFLFNLRGTPFSLSFFNQRDIRPPNHSYSFYLMDYWRLTNQVTAELGVFKDFTKNSRAGYASPVSTSLWSPRLGLNYQVNSQHTLRLALQRHLSTHNIITPILAPGEVASFPWLINVDDGSLVREVGLAWEAQWDTRTFTVLRLDGLRVDNPQFNPFALGDQRIWLGYKRYLAHLTLNRILHPAWGLSCGVVGKRVTFDQFFQAFNPNFKAFTEFDAFLGLSFLHHTGWQGGISAALAHQSFSDRNNNLFGLVNLRFGKEFDHKRGFFSLEVNNLFNRHFFYMMEPVSLVTVFPSRQVIFRLGLYF